MEAVLDELKQLIKARYPFVYLVSYEEERVTRGLKWLCGNQEERLSIWTCSNGFESTGDLVSEARDPLEALEVVRVHPPRQLFLFKDFYPYFDDPKVRRKLRDLEPLLEEDQKTLLFLAPTAQIPRDLEKDMVVLDVPLPGAPEVAKLLGGLVKTQGLKMTTDLFEKIVKASLGLTEKELKKVYSRILISGHSFTEEDLGLLFAEKRKILRSSQYLEYVELEEDMSSVGGLGQLKAWLTERGASFSEKARKYGLPQPKGMFLLGVQGCGKSLTAKAVAQFWKMPLLRLDLASMFTMSSSGAEQNLRDTIRIAESMAPVVLWIDEIEKAIAGMTGAGETTGHASRVFGTLLTWFQEKKKPVFVIATANEVKHLPPELLRKGRFDEIFFIDLPSIHDRVEILSIHLRKRHRNPDKFDLYPIGEVTERYSGAELEQLVLSALYYAFAQGREMTAADLLRQARESVPLAVTMSEMIKELKDWAQYRTRAAAFDSRRVDFFEEWEVPLH